MLAGSIFIGKLNCSVQTFRAPSPTRSQIQESLRTNRLEADMRPKKEAGQALILTAVGLVVLLGFTGLGVDMGVLRYQKRLQQTAADAAAIAGATNLTPYTGVQAGAQGASASNNFTD